MGLKLVWNVTQPGIMVSTNFWTWLWNKRKHPLIRFKVKLDNLIFVVMCEERRSANFWHQGSTFCCLFFFFFDKIFNIGVNQVNQKIKFHEIRHFNWTTSVLTNHNGLSRSLLTYRDHYKVKTKCRTLSELIKTKFNVRFRTLLADVWKLSKYRIHTGVEMIF